MLDAQPGVGSDRFAAIQAACEGGVMPKVVITHNVVDLDKWLKGKSERSESVAGLGGSNVVDHVAHDGSNSVAVAFEADDVEGLVAAIADPPAELAAAMERHGVVPPLAVYIAK